MAVRIATFLTICGLLTAASGGAQSTQYISPGSFGSGEEIPTREYFDLKMEKAPWRAGPLRLSPWFGLRDAQVVDNLVSAGGESDFTATAGAGLRAYTRTGSKLTWAAHALPHYTWWDDAEGKRQVGGRYGLGVFGDFNRLRFELSGRLSQSQTFFSSELQELTPERRELSRVAATLELSPRLSLYAGYRLTDFENEEDDDVIFSRLDREEEVLAAGVRYSFPGARWGLSLGYEDTTTDFASAARNLSNTGDAITFGVDFTGPRFAARASLAERSLEPEPGSEFGGFDETTGRLDAVWDLSSRSSLLTYAWRGFGFSALGEGSHFTAERYGFNLAVTPGRLNVRLLAELGEDRHEPIAGGGGAERTDDVTGYGVSLSLPMGRLVSLTLNAMRTDYDSNFDELDREVTSYGLGLQLGPQLEEWVGRFTERLRLGDPGGTW